MINTDYADKWQVIAASVRGTSHEKTGQPCQDVHHWEMLPDGILVAAVADGAGSAALGEVGAAWAWAAVGFALLAFVPALRLWAGPVAVVCGIVGWKRARTSTRRDRWMAGSAVGVGVLMVFLFLYPYGVRLFNRPQDGSAGASLSPSADGAPMVLMPAGEFQMGSNDGGGDEKPVHTVYLDAFYIDKYEVTNAQYRKFVQATGHPEPKGYGYINGNWQNGFEPWKDSKFNAPNQPVVCVSWHDAAAYAQWAEKRLPTEAEWEKAARGGPIGKQYVWGDTVPPPKGAGNFTDETAKKTFPGWTIFNGYDDGYVYPAPVGSFSLNGYGLYDMAGNVWEWCMDEYDSGFYAKSQKNNPVAGGVVSFVNNNFTNVKTLRVCRGGGWNGAPSFVRVAYRGSYYPTTATTFFGFRCAGPVTP